MLRSTHAPRTRLDVSERPLRNINTRDPKFLSPGLIHQSSPRSCVHGAVTVRSRHSWSPPILLFVSSVSDSTACQHFRVLCPFPACDRCSRPASPSECPLHSALVPMSTSFSLRCTSCELDALLFHMTRGTSGPHTARLASSPQRVVGSRMRPSCNRG